jgi:parallel beta-helix repeat protein
MPFPTRLSQLLPALAAAAIALPAVAFPGIRDDWQDRYGAISPSADAANCQLCHVDANGGPSWNGYGWDLRNARDDLACDVGGDGTVSWEEAFYCVEALNSDGDGSGNDNVGEIGVGAQPGWTAGPNNTHYSDIGNTFGNLPPTDIGLLDPDGTEPPPPVEPPPPSDDEPEPETELVQLVWPGQSIQRAIDRSLPGGVIFVLPGTYREVADPTNGLNIGKSIHLVGLSWGDHRVVLANAGNQRNGLVAVPEDRQDCMSCHSDMAPPFPIYEGVEPGLKMREPMIHALSIRGITIRGFRNNGLFTENVDGFVINDVESIDNKNYGIFPTLSRRGIIVNSYATGANDSGIWVETSENVVVVNNLVEDNTNGFELSNSDDVWFLRNEARKNTVGFAILLLPDIFDDRPGAKRIRLVRNHVHDNNRTNMAREGSILAEVPSGIGMLHLGVDDSVIAENLFENNHFIGHAMADYCVVTAFTAFPCPQDPFVTPEFEADQAAANNTVVRNVFVNNGTEPEQGSGFEFAASDLGYLAFGNGQGNCWSDNVFSTFFSIIGPLPECPPAP